MIFMHFTFSSAASTITVFFSSEVDTMKKKAVKLVIASTTSTHNSGLFDILIPAYEKATSYGVTVEVIAVGTGKAMRIAKKGEADLLFVHDPYREEKFIAEGYGVNRRQVMHNDFVILGPKNDRPGSSPRAARHAQARSAQPTKECRIRARGHRRVGGKWGEVELVGRAASKAQSSR